MNDSKISQGPGLSRFRSSSRLTFTQSGRHSALKHFLSHFSLHYTSEEHPQSLHISMTNGYHESAGDAR
ncbi:hypothetical protein CY34DRAFT_689779 [Suillus luteus UH-Slu-Lm8-n1]|uniref:Uncharacterized protein n=1 Tax=Suillus luteus UH-Slu-Lm8-n1 TaxID=930992 RepID=A0A0D0APE6_9AGAM|nr:hypothetical protein CY34DRAFT_689779 [Suillus luteus UH-Slu-Lm8-n1]